MIPVYRLRLSDNSPNIMDIYTAFCEKATRYKLISSSILISNLNMQEFKAKVFWFSSLKIRWINHFNGSSNLVPSAMVRSLFSL